jgi:hypothetical protein
MVLLNCGEILKNGFDAGSTEQEEFMQRLETDVR